jgi:hypothetical protein
MPPRGTTSGPAPPPPRGGSSQTGRAIPVASAIRDPQAGLAGSSGLGTRSSDSEADQ